MLLIPYSIFFSKSTLNQMRKMEANAAKINERVHRLIRSKVRGKWPQRGPPYTRARVSFALFRPTCIGFLALDVESPLSGLFFRFGEAGSPFLPYPFPPPSEPMSPTTQGWECVWPRSYARRSAAVAAYVMHSRCIECRSVRIQIHTRPRNFNSATIAFRDQITSKLGKHKREKWSILRDKTIQMSLLGISITV